MTKPKALVLHAAGTNRDPDACAALELAGAQPEIVHVNQLRRKERRISDYQMLLLPGGFSYADALGAGRLIALDLTRYFEDEVKAFVESGKPVIGICNGFQALVKSGILPDADIQRPTPRATLAHNELGRFECRWVFLEAKDGPCVWTKGIGQPIFCPIAHGEGNFVTDSEATLDELEKRGQLALRYVNADGTPARGAYPANPNGSLRDVAGVCNKRGNVLGLMPHPEDNIFARQDTGKIASSRAISGLKLFENGVRYAASL